MNCMDLALYKLNIIIIQYNVVHWYSETFL